MSILSHALASLHRWFIPLIAVLSAVAIPATPVWSAGSVETAAVMAPSPATCYFRGTPNDWGKTPMTFIAGTNCFEICQTFAGKPNPRFKICCSEDWRECYPPQDLVVTDGTYRITFDAGSRQITTPPVAADCGPLPDTWYFRGTPNSWGTTPIERVGNSNVFKTCQTFSGVPNPRFKICHFQNWRECYPPQDRFVSDGAQEVTFNADPPHDITVSTVPNCGGQDRWFFRGTPNGWGTTPMEQVDNSDVFKITVNFARQDPEPHKPRFKIDHFGDWRENYPAQDVSVDDCSRYEIKFNRTTKDITNNKIGLACLGFDWRNAVVYYVFTDRLADGITANNHAYGRELNQNGTEVDGYKAKSMTFHGGDFKGLTDKINSGYFNDLGVTALWVGAPYEQIHGWISSGSSDNVTGKRSYAFHGYWPLDFTETDQNYGTAAEFQTFVDAAHAKGLRIVMDVVMNHTGYITLKDMEDFRFGQFKTDAQGHDWQSFYYDNALDGHFTNDQESQYIDSTAASQDSWNRWYGVPWVRAGLPGYEPLGGVGYVPGSPPTPEQFLKGADQFGLPDFKTEETVGLGLPPLLQSKWGATKAAAEDAAMTTFVNTYGTELGSTQKTVRSYLIKWLTDWVEKYGIDGFRCDTAANVEKEAWKSLKAVAQKRFNAWKVANPSKKLDDSPFWMVGERGDRDPPAADENNPYYRFGFDAMIDFEYWGSFPSNANLTSWSGLESIFHSYSRLRDANPMSMISNHDYGMYWKSQYENGSFGNASGDAALQKKAGTLLLLTPGTVNLLYGDEAGRDPGVEDSLEDSPLKDYRTDFEPTENLSTVKLDILNHWKKLGQFRKAHPAVGAGIHTKLKDSPYTFQRVLGDDKIIVVLGAQGDVTVDVSGLFTNGTTLRDAYTGTVKKVSAGTVTFTVDQNKTLLLEQQF